MNFLWEFYENRKYQLIVYVNEAYIRLSTPHGHITETVYVWDNHVGP